jgi:hypothetical protein
MAAGHDFSLGGLAMGLAMCFVAHVLMVPMGLDTLAHDAGHALSDTFAGASDPSSMAANTAAPAPDCHFDNGVMHCEPHG